ncbi:HigA family addiction module antitoxin [Myxococcota bacterium]
MPIAVPKNRPPTTPGEIIHEEFLVPLGISQAELARQMGVPTNRVSQLISGRRSLTAETALRLEAVLGVDATTWMNLQAACDIWEARKAKPARGLKRIPELKSA